MDNWKKVLNEVTKGGGRLDIREYLSRSEAPDIFTTALNDILVQGGSPELPDNWNRIYQQMNLVGRRDINFPSIRGVNPDLVPELSEFKFTDHEQTSVTVVPQKFGMRIGLSREIIEDGEISMLAWRTREAGRAHRELKRREAFKAVSFFSTGPALGKSTGVVGVRNHGLTYAQGGYTNFLSATALTWEERIDVALTTLLTQTITVADMTISFPVRADTIVANPGHERAIKKVLNAGITVVTTGVGAGAGGVGNLAGSNVFNNLLPNQVYDPTIPTGQALIMDSRRGLMMVNRTPLELETLENSAFDADELKTRERFLPAVIEERFIFDLQIEV